MPASGPYGRMATFAKYRDPISPAFKPLRPESATGPGYLGGLGKVIEGAPERISGGGPLFTAHMGRRRFSANDTIFRRREHSRRKHSLLHQGRDQVGYPVEFCLLIRYIQGRAPYIYLTSYGAFRILTFGLGCDQLLIHGRAEFFSYLISVTLHTINCHWPNRAGMSKMN